MGDMSREPSMEDILSSIRRVIARDEATVQARMARVGSVDNGAELADKPDGPSVEKPDISTLEKITLSPHGAPSPAPTPAPHAHDAPPAVPSAAPMPTPTAPLAAQPSSAPAQPVNDTLISNASAEAARQSLESLNTAFALSPNSAASAISSPGRTIDDVVMEALRPMLKTWLDQNLPPIVEAMVAKEIRRITSQR